MAVAAKSVALIRVCPWGILFYNHARRLRLEKLLLYTQYIIELSRSPSGYFKSLPDPGGGFRSETAVM
jgi:hypothetical protein